MVDHFASPKQRLARAKQHIGHLDGRIKKFFKKQPHAHVVEPNADGSSNLHKCA
jgi:hypothetical protein